MFLKIFLLGTAKVGKSSLLARFCSGKPFDAGYRETIGPDFNGTKVKLSNGQQAILQIWDLPGNPQHLARLPQEKRTYYADTHVCVLVCDMCSRDSFIQLERLREEFYLSFPVHERDSLAFVLLINKAEPIHAKKQQVFASDVLAWCSKHNIRHFYETSALTDTNVLIALLNITQLASEMDQIRRGNKIQLDAVEMARREAAEQAKAAARLKQEQEAQAAKEAAEKAAREEEERVARERLEGQQKREAEFEARWAAQREEEEKVRLAQQAEKARLSARRKATIEKRKKEVAQSAYGPFKQRAHRLSLALIQQHAATSGEPDVDYAALGITPQVLAQQQQQQQMSPSTIEEEPLHPGVPKIVTKPGVAPSSLHATPQPRTRPSVLGMGTGALLKQARTSSEPITPKTDNTSAPATGRAGKRTQRRPPTTTPSHHSIGGGGTSESLVIHESDEHKTQPSIVPPTAADPAPTPSPVESVPDEPEPEFDSVSSALLEYIGTLVSWSRKDCIQFFKFFLYSPAGIPFKQFKKLWSKLSHCNPAYPALIQRFFAIMDTKHQGAVEYEEFMLKLQTLFHGPTGARAELVFNLLNYEQFPFIPSKPPADSSSNTNEESDPSTSQSTLTKAGLIDQYRSKLLGQERFDYDMYDTTDEATSESSSIDATSTPTIASASFISRDNFTKLASLLLESQSAFQALLKSGVSSTTIQQRLQPLVHELVDSWFISMNQSKSHVITLPVWKDAVRKRSELIQPYLPRPPPDPVRT